MSETLFQTCMKQAISEIPVVRYKGRNKDGKPEAGLDNSSATGVIDDLYFKDELILAAKNDGVQVSICSGVQLRAFVMAVEKHPQLKEKFTPKMMRDLIKWAYVYKGPEDEEGKWSDGLPGGLVEMGMAEFVDDPFEARYGDLCQIQGISFDDSYDDGHAVIVERFAERHGRPVLWCWSSSPSIKGVGSDWFWIFKERNYIERTWSIARMIEG